MKICKNNRDEKLAHVTKFMQDHGFPKEKTALERYAVEILKSKQAKSPGKNISGSHLKRVLVDCKERAIASLCMYYHANNISCKLGFFYIIKCASYPNYYKLGFAKDAEARLNVYQTYSPFRDFSLFRYLAVEDRRQAEQLAINFIGSRMSNEWFYSEDIDADFKNICKHIAIKTNKPNRFYWRI